MYTAVTTAYWLHLITSISILDIMQIKLSWQYLVAFAALILVLKELHELSHILSSYLFYGCWGPYRDFNVISMCNAAEEGSPGLLISSINGPLFSFACMWTGLYLMHQRSRDAKWLGFALLFATKPFARLFTALVNGGDELGVLRSLLSPTLNNISIQLLGAGLILLFIAPPLCVAYKNIHNQKKAYWFTGYFLLPMLFDFVVVHTLLNNSLKSGFLDTPFLFATPWLVHLVFWLALLTLLIFRKSLLNYPQEQTATPRAISLGKFA